MGADALVDVHIQVSSRLSVSEGHQISEMVRMRLIEQMEEVADVMVHIDPENDERGSPGFNLPLRREVEKQLQQAWADIPIAEKIEYITLHYLGGKIHVDLQLPLDVCTDRDSAKHIKDSLITASKAVENIGDVSVCFN
jgi:divalent metal cation (Fe/Co/Zn/Cd) transporter